MELFKKFATVASGTAASRLFGFLREMLMAVSLGTGPTADAFNAAFRFPNSFRRLFAEGALSSAFIPLFTKDIEEKGLDQARDFAAQVFGVLFTTLLLITIIAQISMPLLVRYIIAPGFEQGSTKYYMTIRFALIMFPYLSCMSLTAIISGMLNSLHRYFAASIAPIFLNFILILVLIYSYYYHLDYWTTGLALSKGVMCAGLIQLALVYSAALKAGIKLKIKPPHFTPKIRKLLTLAFPAAISGGITQINLLINTSIASGDSGAISTLAYADRLYQLPLGIIGISVATVLLPELSSAQRSKIEQKSQELQNRAIEFTLFLALPAAMALLIMAQPIVRLLLEHGNFGVSSTIKVAGVLTIYGLGLPAFILIKALVPNYFARHDTKTPLSFAAISVAINIFLALTLFPYFSARGIAIAEIFTAWVNCALLFFGLKKRKYFIADGLIAKRLYKFIIAAGIMGLFLLLAQYYFSFALSSQSTNFLRILTNLAIIILAMLIYLLVTIMLKAIDINILKNKLRR
ncbi:murein biosynthesis integral membrane protein MurJ [Bartonella sp. TP]|uniref:murein biosynthesis integral membrane protein MurJ n=1 Tax=Bartonella sp. TP TaxID=3057550 RepID=UPI0025B046CF|nr:murein biosynthesis integral membrane protein MurJ [Bartonella sp. TP]WJW80295.1 murein biosynthesis integral membrane protein MurJ [Bartonella sp. TP]